MRTGVGHGVNVAVCDGHGGRVRGQIPVVMGGGWYACMESKRDREKERKIEIEREREKKRER